MNNLKILHVASFEGNIGDNANHSGMRSRLEQNLGRPLEFTNCEIREFYWKKRFFDDSFVALANAHDLVVIGGGNYFELWVQNSATGTSIDITLENLKKIKPPVVFNALGCDRGQGVCEGNKEKFEVFLDYACHSDKCLVSVRNDGSYGTLQFLYGNKYDNLVHRIPDGGFFTQLKTFFHPEISKKTGAKSVGVNLAGDMLDVRFSENSETLCSYPEFCKSFASFVDSAMARDPELNFIFFPHIFRDLNVISDVLALMKDSHRRTRTTVAPYLHGDGAQEYIFDLYRGCNLILGMRFHANVCSVATCTPVIGLVNYTQIEYLFEEMELQDSTVRVNKKGFETELMSKFLSHMENTAQLKYTYEKKLQALDDSLRNFHLKIKSKFNLG